MLNIKDSLRNKFDDFLNIPQDQEVRDFANDKKGKARNNSLGKKESGSNPKRIDSAPPGTKRCQFCGRVDKNFLETKLMDMHYWKECPMLVTCQSCGQVLPIENYKNHLLTECQIGRFEECPRCKQAIEQSKYNDHIKKYTCNPARPLNEATRCALCGTDHEPTVEGLTYHIMTEGCPNNPRTAG